MIGFASSPSLLALASLLVGGPAHVTSAPVPSVQDVLPAGAPVPVVVSVPVAAPVACSGAYEAVAGDPARVRLLEDAGWLEYEVEVPVAGRYRLRLEVGGAADSDPTPATAWVEDHVHNTDGRTYDITGPRAFTAGPELALVEAYGSPLDEGEHSLRVHLSGPRLEVASLKLDLLRRHRSSPEVLVQSTEGDEWSLVWSDEFEGDGPVDPAKWTYDVGDWGWGNREPQFYTEARLENARREAGRLVIEARRDDEGHPWTSARLTTRGKVAFLYGRIEIRAQVPSGDGTWAAGWLLGDAYRDELSWPYCGEIDVCEAVGREIDDETGDGVNHASCHTRAYYFKQGNHISNQIPVEGMSEGFHTYTVEWEPDEIRMYVGDVHYYTYDKTGDRLSWPFSEPQNLILNLAMGGGMGGAIDPELTSQRFVIDHVRVFERR